MVLLATYNAVNMLHYIALSPFPGEEQSGKEQDVNAYKHFQFKFPHLFNAIFSVRPVIQIFYAFGVTARENLATHFAAGSSCGKE